MLLRIFAVIALLIGMFIIVGLVRGSLTSTGVGVGLVLGFAIGAILTRTSDISWDTDAGAIATNLGWIGGVVLVANLISVIFKESILGAVFSHSSAISIHSAGLAVTAGVMTTRVTSSRRAILDLAEAIRVDAGAQSPQGNH